MVFLRESTKKPISGIYPNEIPDSGTSCTSRRNSLSTSSGKNDIESVSQSTISKEVTAPLNDDKTNAGYIPAKKLVKIQIINKLNTTSVLE